MNEHMSPWQRGEDHKWSRLYRPAKIEGFGVVALHDRENNITYLNSRLYDQLSPAQQSAVKRRDKPVVTLDDIQGIL